jgi:diaminobutyrate-2-oxoglutarate transaminase
MRVFEQHESRVRKYSRSWPVVFDRAEGSWIYGEDGRRYLDFFAGAGSVNYGHNNAVLRTALERHLARGGIANSLDMATTARRSFLESFVTHVLGPRNLKFRIQFPGPAGTTAVEAALRLARKVTGRPGVLYFEGGFHGMTLGSSSVSDRSTAAQEPNRYGTRCIPFATDVQGSITGLSNAISNGVNGQPPAAVILETVQGEGGIRIAEVEWLRAVEALCREAGVLLIVDDIQMGIGRTGPFFSFERAGINPDLVCLSKSLSGFGMPLAVTLIRPEHDVWTPGEHSGTFRGFDLALVTARAALDHFWVDDNLVRSTEALGEESLGYLRAALAPAGISVRGRGLAIGIELPDEKLAKSVSRSAFDAGLLVETCGTRGEVVKLMPPLTITPEEMDIGLHLLLSSLHCI